MNWRNLREILKAILFLQLFLFGIFTILATGGGSDPVDVEKPGSLSFNNSSYSSTEGTDATVTITVIRTGGTDGAVSVDYSTSNGSATEPGDYTSTSGTLNWADGDDAEKTFDVPITDDGAPETPETFTVTLSNAAGGASIGTTGSATVNIADDDIGSAPGTLQFENTNYSVTEGVNPTVTLSVTRTLGSSGAVSVDYSTVNGTAVQPGDYTGASGRLDWADGDTATKTFDISITDDSAPEVIESFSVILNNALGGASIGPNAPATVSITDNDQITGTVSAPGGVLALKEPGILERMFALLFGKNLQAAIGDLVAPVPGVTVNLYEIDADGVISAVIDTATTDASGQYVLAAPPVDAPAVKYIVRAGGVATMDSRVTSMQVDVNPTTDATSDLITTIATDLADLTINEVQEIQSDIEELIPFIVTTDTPNASQISTRLQEQALRKAGQFRVLSSKVSGGSICGAIRSSIGVGLQGVDVIVRTYSDWKLIAKTVTDSVGEYCVNVPLQGDVNPDGGNFDGEYIVGANNSLNSTVDVFRSASGWRSSGAPATRLDADKTTVTVGTPVVNFTNIQLVDGATLTGTVKAAGSGANLEGVDILLSDFDSGVSMVSTSVAPDGTYRINVLPGTYRVEAVNTTQAGYASELYDGSSGTNNYQIATPVTLAVGTETAMNFTLESGAQLTGTIIDGATSDPVINTRVRVYLAGDAYFTTEHTDRLGYYHIWLKPDSYDVFAYGQNSKAVNLGTAGSTVAVDFSDSVSKITGALQDGSMNPVRHAKLRLHDSTPTLVSQEIGDKNGNFTVYTNQTGDHFLEIRIDRDGTSVGSIIYNGQTQLLGGTAIPIASAGDDQDLGTITLPAGGMLRGNVYTDALKTTSMANFRIQVRDGGVLPDNRFITLRTRGDGSYLMALPETTYERVKMMDATNTGNCDNVDVVAGNTTVLNYINSSDTCE